MAVLFNPYQILGVSSLSTKEEIKKRYRELARQYHPDNQGGDTEMFNKIQQAWEYINANHQEFKGVGKGVWRHSSLFSVYLQE